MRPVIIIIRTLQFRRATGLKQMHELGPANIIRSIPLTLVVITIKQCTCVFAYTYVYIETRQNVLVKKHDLLYIDTTLSLSLSLTFYLFRSLLSSLCDIRMLIRQQENSRCNKTHQLKMRNLRQFNYTQCQCAKFLSRSNVS